MLVPHVDIRFRNDKPTVRLGSEHIRCKSGIQTRLGVLVVGGPDIEMVGVDAVVEETLVQIGVCLRGIIEALA